MRLGLLGGWGLGMGFSDMKAPSPLLPGTSSRVLRSDRGSVAYISSFNTPEFHRASI